MYCHIHHCHYHHCNCVPKDSKEKGGALTQEELLALTEEMKEELKDYTVDLKDQIFSYIDVGLNPVEIANTFASLKEQDTYILRTLTQKIDELNNTTNLSMFNLRTRVTNLEGQSATILQDLADRTQRIGVLEDELSSLPFEDGVLDDSFVTMTAKSDVVGSVVRNLHEVNADILRATDFGLVGDGVTDDSVNLQKALTHQDKARTSSTFIPMQYQNYVLDNTITLQEPSMIYGNKGASYNRGGGKNGNLILRDAMVGIDLGNSRSRAKLEGPNDPSYNPADNWTVKNIGLLPHPSTPNNTKIGIQHTAASNGPDRGLVFREVSGRGFASVINIKHNDVQTQAGTLVVENCCLSNNAVGILAEGSVYGARIVGNQIEQNSSGSIHGALQGPVTIHDNMLEGTVNTINLSYVTENLSGNDLSLVNNYFELNSGDYLVKIESISGCSVYTRGNYVSGFLSGDGVTPNTDRGRPKDHLLLKGNFHRLHVYDSLSVSFYDNATLGRNNNLNKYLVYVGSSGLFKSLQDYKDNCEKSNNSASPSSPNRTVSVAGTEYYKLSGGYNIINKSLSPNDVIEVNITYVCTPSSRPIDLGILTILGSTDAIKITSGSVVGTLYADNKIHTTKVVLNAKDVPTSSVRVLFRPNDSVNTAGLSILGVSVDTLGTYVADAPDNTVNRFIVTDRAPKLYKVSDGLKIKKMIGARSIAPSESYSVTQEMQGVINTDTLVALPSITNTSPDLTIETTLVGTTTTAVITNNGVADLEITAEDYIEFYTRRNR